MLNELENKIRKAIPELNELGVGCVLNCYQKLEQENLLVTIVGETNKNYWILKHVDNDVTDWDKETILDESSYEIVSIIGKPIQLNHVLEYVLPIYKNKGLESHIYFDIIYYWNLKSNLLSEQSEELIKYINEL